MSRVKSRVRCVCVLVVLRAVLYVHDKQMLECVQLFYGVVSLLVLRQLLVAEKSRLKIMQIEE